MISTPKTIAITGGIGAGKSYVCRVLEQQGATIFYTDPAAKHIIRTNPQVQREIRAVVGNDVYAADGTLVKPILARYLCQGAAFSRRIDAIVHPRVAEAWHEFLAAHRHIAPRSKHIYMECALLFESGFERFVDHTLLVTCPDELRIARVMQRDDIDRATALRWMALQMPEEEKQRRSDFTLINDGNADILEQLSALSLLP